MYNKLLVAIDHSAISDRVLAAATELAGSADCEIEILHLREREVIGRLGQVPAESDTEAEDQVDAAVGKVAESGLRARGTVRDSLFGQAAREIVEEARRIRADVIVMGSRGRGDLAGLLLGSTAHKVIHLTDRPVLIVR
ncbi:MAG: universal stress protein [Actinomycetota bacterium]|nr:universal stress protein [Actinomycetota bacterium]